MFISRHILCVNSIRHISSFEVNAVIIKYELAKVIIRSAYCFYFSQLAQIVVKRGDLILGIFRIKTEDESFIFIEAEIFFADIIQLAIDNDNTRNQHNG